MGIVVAVLGRYVRGDADMNTTAPRPYLLRLDGTTIGAFWSEDYALEEAAHLVAGGYTDVVVVNGGQDGTRREG